MHQRGRSRPAGSSNGRNGRSDRSVRNGGISGHPGYDARRDERLDKAAPVVRRPRPGELGPGRRPGDPLGGRARPGRAGRRGVVTLKERYGLFINGREVPSSDGAVFPTVNPATEEKLADVSRATPADVDRAIRAARRAQRRSWGALPGRERAKYLFRIARILQERSREFAVLETVASGKPIKESRDVDIPLAAAPFWDYAGWADEPDYAL